MNQLIAHLIGDYILQSHAMATNKTNKSLWAIYHAVMYTVPFVFITQNILQLIVISLSHFLVDRFRLAVLVVKIKNYILGDFKWYSTNTRYPDNTPPFLSVWLLIIADNTIHITINYLAILYLTILYI
jgi:hypothetical protein